MSTKITLENPASWIKGDLVEMQKLIRQCKNDLHYSSETARELEAIGARDSAQKMREKVVNFNQTALADLRKVFHRRCENERPEITTLISGDSKGQIRERIAFMQTHNYPMDDIAKQYGELSGKE